MSSSSSPRKRKSESSSTAPAKRKATSTTTAAGVSNFFKPSSQKEPEPTTWSIVAKTLLVGKYSHKSVDRTDSDAPAQITGGVKVAGFDLDSTLISTASGKKFAKDAQDWKWWHASVLPKLKSLHGAGYQIVLFTNQNGIPDPTKDSPRLMAFKTKIADIFKILDIPGILVYAATANDKYRKPRPGMWEKLLDDLSCNMMDEGRGIDMKESYLVGDAAGREGDFSDTDRNWAMNLKIGFHTPEEFFLNEAPRPMSHKFDPSIYITKTITTLTTTTPTIKQSFTPNTNAQEIILFCGSPGSGKSTFYRRTLKPLGYEHINQDILKTKPKCLKVAREHLSAGKSIAIDNTNADIATRKLWIDLAKEKKLRIRCIYFTAGVELCTHNAAVRAFGGAAVNPEGREMVPRIAFAGFKSRFVEPEVNEGLDEVCRIDFEWGGDEKEKELWCRFWT